MKIIVVAIFSISRNLAAGLPETWGARHAGSGVMDPCMKEKCPHISTRLLSQKEYYWRRNNMDKIELAKRPGKAIFPAGEDYVSLKNQLWKNKKIIKKPETFLPKPINKQPKLPQPAKTPVAKPIDFKPNGSNKPASDIASHLSSLLNSFFSTTASPAPAPSLPSLVEDTEFADIVNGSEHAQQ
jgi:hypothetical protein